jgi:hypothetical protein
VVCLVVCGGSYVVGVSSGGVESAVVEWCVCVCGLHTKPAKPFGGRRIRYWRWKRTNRT